jgi:dTDP-4-amino-4,6-dideoxy-D-galactose acyltransferase
VSDFNCQRLEWDSEFFGFPVGRLDGNDLGSMPTQEFVSWCESQRMRCVYCLIGCGDLVAVRKVLALGFDYVDVRITLEAENLEPANPAFSGPFVVRHCQEVDLPFIKEIAARSHFSTRFFADRRFPAHLSAEMYEIWIEKAYADRTGILFVAEVGGYIAGYIACRKVDSSEGQIDLLAVGKESQGLGIGRALIAAGARWFCENGIVDSRVITQGRNDPALRLYQSCGYRVISSELWFHWWSGQDDD